jgi:hypothetical protein
VRSHPYETIHTEEIPSLLNTAYKQISVIAKAVSKFAKTGIYPLNPDVFSEEDFISGEVPTTISATVSAITFLRSIAPQRWVMVRSACFLFLTNSTFSLRDTALLLIHDNIS